MHEVSIPTSVLRAVVSDGKVTREEVTCPPLLPNYQAFMQRVERGNQLIGYYSLSRRSRKCWKWVFRHIIEVVVLNAYIIQKDSRPCLDHKKHDYLEFRYAFAEELIGSFSSRCESWEPHSLKNQQALQSPIYLSSIVLSMTVLCVWRYKKLGD